MSQPYPPSRKHSKTRTSAADHFPPLPSEYTGPQYVETANWQREFGSHSATHVPNQASYSVSSHLSGANLQNPLNLQGENDKVSDNVVGQSENVLVS